MSWAKFDDGYDDNPKCRAAGKDGRALDQVGIRHCARDMTDGLIADYDLPVLAAKAEVHPKRTVAKLVEVGRWHQPGHHCEACPDVPAGHVYVHDYLDYNPSAERELAKRRARAEAGRRGGKKSRPPTPPNGTKPRTDSDHGSEAIASQDASPLLKQNGSTELSGEPSKNGTPYPVSPSLPTVSNRSTSVGRGDPHAESGGPPPAQEATSPKRPKPKPEVHPEARRLCDLLADSIANRGSKRPTVSDAWLLDMDKLMRLDGRTPAQVEGFVRWLADGAHPVAQFWQPNIRSPRKMREQWDRVREQRDAANRKANSPPPGGGGPAGRTARAFEDTLRQVAEDPYFAQHDTAPPQGPPQLRVVNQ